MFLHLGRDVTVHVKNIIAIIALKTISEAEASQRFIKTAEEEGFVKVIGDNRPKSMVVCERALNKHRHNKKVRSIVYFSPISSSTLRRRAGSIK